MKAVSLNPKKILVWLLCIAVAQFAVYLLIATFKPEGINEEGFWGLFNMDREQSLPTWYSQFLFLAPAALMAWLAYISTQKNNRVYWALLSGLMIFLSMDDGAMIHERFWIISQFFVASEGVFHYPWTAVAIPLVIIVCLAFIKFFFRLPARTKLLFIAAGLLFLSGAIGLEMYTSYVVGTTGQWVSPFVVGLEETLELAGVTVLTYALLDHIAALPKKQRSITLEVSR